MRCVYISSRVHKDEIREIYNIIYNIFVRMR